MNNPEAIKRRIIITLNQCFCDFGIRFFTKKHLLELARQDVHVLSVVLQDWEEKKFIKIVKPLEEAVDQDICVQILLPIEGAPY